MHNSINRENMHLLLTRSVCQIKRWKPEYWVSLHCINLGNIHSLLSHPVHSTLTCLTHYTVHSILSYSIHSTLNSVLLNTHYTYCCLTHYTVHSILSYSIHITLTAVSLTTQYTQFCLTQVQVHSLSKVFRPRDPRIKYRMSKFYPILKLLTL